MNILTDPIWSNRASPSQLFGPARILEPPIEINSLLSNIQIVLISHSHYDHLDSETVRSIGNNKLWYIKLFIPQSFHFFSLYFLCYV